MDTNAERFDQPHSWNTHYASDVKYGAIAFTVFNAIAAIFLTLQTAQLRFRSGDARWTFHFVTMFSPILIPCTAYSARRFAKKLTSDTEYQKDVMCTIWYALGGWLFVCYLMLMLVINGLSR